ncbi:hypothetical protein MMC26_003561 [Xylographa opegraphella]|nr:hypothetical protein [Xylographa opegraphella]
MNPPPPPPPPPPHGDTSGNRSGLPPGNYDIFIIPPHSAGSGFLYLPSLQPHRNSFLAGVASTLLAVAIWTIVFPVLKEWFATIVASGGTGVILLLIGVGVAGWAWGKTQLETGGSTAGGSAGGAPHSHHNPGASNTYANASSSHHAGPPPGTTGGMPEPTPGPPPPSAGARPPPKPTWQRNTTGPAPTANPTSAKNGWEKAREETRKKEEERRKADELRKKREEDLKRREEEEKERVKQREKDAREREARERREKAAAAAAAAAAAKPPDPPPPSPHPAPTTHKPPPPTAYKPPPPTPSRPQSPTKKPPPPTAHTAPPSTYSFRPYDTPSTPKTTKPSHKSSASSIYSAASSIPSQSTARTTPPPSARGPYSTKDPDKIVLKAVYAFTRTFAKMPLAQLVGGAGAVTDGLVLRITTEGLFIDDDVRGVPQREWDVKAWTLRLVESGDYHALHVLRASIRDQENTRYVFVLQQEEAWKVAVGLQRLRRGTQVRALGVSGLPPNETRAVLESMGWA